MNITQDGIIFRSDRNFMKRDPSSGSTTMLGPNVGYYFDSFYARDLVINHGLGYEPFFRAYYEPYRDGVLYPIVNDTDHVLSTPINDFVNFYEDAPVMIAEVDDVNLTLRLLFPYNTLAALGFEVYWVIYKDFGLEP